MHFAVWFCKDTNIRNLTLPFCPFLSTFVHFLFVIALCSVGASQTWASLPLRRLRDHETTRLQVAAALGFATASQTTRPQDYETTSRQVVTALLQWAMSYELWVSYSVAIRDSGIPLIRRSMSGDLSAPPSATTQVSPLSIPYRVYGGIRWWGGADNVENHEKRMMSVVKSHGYVVCDVKPPWLRVLTMGVTVQKCHSYDAKLTYFSRVIFERWVQKVETRHRHVSLFLHSKKRFLCFSQITDCFRDNMSRDTPPPRLIP